jgi:hypothetical protein
MPFAVLRDESRQILIGIRLQNTFVPNHLFISQLLNLKALNSYRDPPKLITTVGRSLELQRIVEAFQTIETFSQLRRYPPTSPTHRLTGHRETDQIRSDNIRRDETRSAQHERHIYALETNGRGTRGTDKRVSA